jgi:hypothetical protein
MKFKRFMTMMVAAVAIVVGFSSCSSDDDEDEMAVAEQVAGSYTGQEIISVMGEVSSDVVTNYEFTKATDTTIDMLIPASGESGMMMIPALPVKGLTLTKNGNTITGRAASYAGTVTNASGAEKAYTITNVAVVFHDKNVAVTFSLKYGSMPMLMETTFTGIKK